MHNLHGFNKSLLPRLGIVATIAAGVADIGPVAAAEPNRVIEEIVVTGTKRGAVNVQDVPTSIAVLSDDRMRDLNITNFRGIVSQIPSLSLIDNGPGEQRLVIRGIQSAGQPQVGFYIDEAAPPPMQGASSDAGQRTADFLLVDLARIEVLRGPQSTSFGVNSQTGVLRVITNKPQADAFDFGSTVRFGNTNEGEANWHVEGMVNIPIVEDKLAVRAVGYGETEGGFIDNVRLKNADINDNQTEGFRVRARWTPIANITWDAMVWYQDRDIGGDFNFFPETGDLQQNAFVRENKPDEIELYNTTLNIDTDFAHFTFTGMKYERFFGEQFDSTGVIDSLGVDVPGDDRFEDSQDSIPDDDDEGVLPALAPATTTQDQELDSSMFEGRINSAHGGPFQWLVGGFWRERNSDFRSFVPVADSVTGDPLTLPPTNVVVNPVAGIDGIPGCSPCVFAREAETRIREKAVFGETVFNFEEAMGLPFELLFGLRWFENKLLNTGREVFPFLLFANAPGGEDFPVRTSEDELVKKVSLTWNATNDDNVYFTWGQGFRLGGTNQAGIVDIPKQFGSDEVNNFEVGLKTQWWDGRVTWNTAGFLMFWDDLQVDGTDPTGAFGFIGNAGEAEVNGIETEIFLDPLPGLRFSGGVTWLPKRELTEDQVTDEVIAPGRDGDEIPRVPEWQASLFTKYEHPLSGAWSDWSVFIQTDASYTGERNTELRPDNPNFLIEDEFWNWNGSLGLTNSGLGLNVNVFVQNISDKRGVVTATASVFEPDALFPTRPRTVGLEVDWQY